MKVMEFRERLNKYYEEKHRITDSIQQLTIDIVERESKVAKLETRLEEVDTNITYFIKTSRIDIEGR